MKKAMYYNELAERARFFKKTEGGRQKMCKIMEDMRNEAVMAIKRENARNLLKIGKLSVEEIAFAIGLTVEEVEELKGTFTA
jgi:predicted transposase YdaD